MDIVLSLPGTTLGWLWLFLGCASLGGMVYFLFQPDRGGDYSFSGLWIFPAIICLLLAVIFFVLAY